MVAYTHNRAATLAHEYVVTLLHPYIDPLGAAGQGTSALEMQEDAPELDVLVIPIGGGGLIAGNVIPARARKSTIEIVGGEAAPYPSFWKALDRENPPLRGATPAESIAGEDVRVPALPNRRELLS